MNRWMDKLLGVILMLMLSGLLQPAMLLAQQAPTEPPAQTQDPQAQPPQSAPPQGDNQAQPAEENPARQDVEDKASQELINRDHLPDSPGAAKPRPEQEKVTPAVAQQPVRSAQPTGTAAAQAGKLSGNAASRPAGAAIAPAKQRQVRSFLIKMGVIAGAGVAIGTVAALSKGSPSRPPGTR